MSVRDSLVVVALQGDFGKPRPALSYPVKLSELQSAIVAQ